MTPVVEQSVSFPKVTPAILYALFMDSAKHTAATGMPAKISRKVGGKWSAFGGMILGKNLALIPNRVIVQSWRSSAWKKDDPDSVLVVRFEKTPDGATASLVHVGVPTHDFDGVTQGWKKYYWEQWEKYFAARKR
jgi:activator of HSP90 ATPase